MAREGSLGRHKFSLKKKRDEIHFESGFTQNGLLILTNKIEIHQYFCSAPQDYLNLKGHVSGFLIGSVSNTNGKQKDGSTTKLRIKVLEAAITQGLTPEPSKTVLILIF